MNLVADRILTHGPCFTSIPVNTKPLRFELASLIICEANSKGRAFTNNRSIGLNICKSHFTVQRNALNRVKRRKVKLPFLSYFQSLGDHPIILIRPEHLVLILPPVYSVQLDIMNVAQSCPI